MDQRRFEFTDDQSHPRYLQLDRDRQQSLLDLMAAFIIHVFHEQEISDHDRPQQPIEDQF